MWLSGLWALGTAYARIARRQAIYLQRFASAIGSFAALLARGTALGEDNAGSAVENLMKPFVYTGLPSRVVFGTGAIEQLPAELDRLGAKRALILSTPEQADGARRVAASLGARAAGIYDKAQMLGMKQSDLPRAASLATGSPYPNPAPVTYDAVLALLRGAYEGRRPAP